MEERKPNPRIYEMVQNECGIKPENILLIEDTEQNIETAKKMGWNTCKAYGYEIDPIKERIKKFLRKLVFIKREEKSMALFSHRFHKISSK